jgi:hypothetical protein
MQLCELEDIFPGLFQTNADVSIIRAKTGTFSIETLDVHRWHPDGRPGLV